MNTRELALRREAFAIRVMTRARFSAKAIREIIDLARWTTKLEFPDLTEDEQRFFAAEHIIGRIKERVNTLKNEANDDGQEIP